MLFKHVRLNKLSVNKASGIKAHSHSALPCCTLPLITIQAGEAGYFVYEAQRGWKICPRSHRLKKSKVKFDSQACLCLMSLRKSWKQQALWLSVGRNDFMTERWPSTETCRHIYVLVSLAWLSGGDNMVSLIIGNTEDLGFWTKPSASALRVYIKVFPALETIELEKSLKGY